MKGELNQKGSYSYELSENRKNRPDECEKKSLASVSLEKELERNVVQSSCEFS